MIGAAGVVFVVDDDQSIREAPSSLFASVGLHVETFGSAQEFLAPPAARRAGCLVLDVRLPGLSGLDLQRELARTRTTIPIIFITGHGDIPMSRAGDEGRRGGVPDQAVPRPGPAGRGPPGASSATASSARRRPSSRTCASGTSR